MSLQAILNAWTGPRLGPKPVEGNFGTVKPMAIKRFTSDTPEAQAQKARILAMTTEERRSVGIVAIGYSGSPVGANGQAKLAAQPVSFVYDPSTFNLDIRV